MLDSQLVIVHSFVQIVGEQKRIAIPIPLILNLLKDVIPSVAEESERPGVDSISGFLDSSATLGMTW